MDSGDDNDDDGEKDSNWVFDWIIEEAETELGKDATLKGIRKLFRQKLTDKIDWYRNLRKNKIFKKIMVTADELHDGPGEYDREEALNMAIRQRRILLDRLIPNPLAARDMDETGGAVGDSDDSDERDNDSDEKS